MSERAREKRRRFMFYLFERLEVKGERLEVRGKGMRPCRPDLKP
jgi:hypothetical protein